ncbi:hypothetical protein L249_5735 [Ophiocordyceps polyrhachis-furcata BCC 54312]|uniref:Amino acid transporter transmembrane domain-containing protein n=1 Tax=Ophiocordyceps polyrhachis-furcata BCC 54312 TaxID=1330021 RepID=A0A367L0D9_9HYPO|nr:hypothetical protein L249_5735 [Ophiocordyceps polyrhachis-furcata BCC 54312]
MSSPKNYQSSSPAPGHSRSFSSSIPRGDLTARLAEPIRSGQRSASPVPEGESPSLVGGRPCAQGPGVSALAAALSDSLGQSPPRFGTPPARVVSPPLRADTPINYGSFDSRSRLGQNGAAAPLEDPEIVKRHLVQPGESENLPSEESSTQGPVRGKQAAEPGTGLNDNEFSSLRLQGGDITRGIYKWTEQAEAKGRLHRSRSFHHQRPEPETDVLDINSIKIPGGFRRNHLRRNAMSPNRQTEADESGVESPPGTQPRLFTSSFLEFLTIYGHFAGEELEEDDEALGPNEEFWSDRAGLGDESDDDREPMEDSALLTNSKRMRRRKPRGGSGKNSPMNAALLLLKSFVGTGVLFLPRAYLSGGMLLSNLVLLCLAGLSYYSFVLLVSTRMRVEGSFGDMGGILYGKWMRNLILASIVISQIGFTAAYTVFTAENLQAFIRAVSDCRTTISIPILILMQTLIFLPFSLLRDIGKLGFTALIADAFILIGLAYLFYYDVLTLSKFGLADIIMFNDKDWTLFIGTAIFTFEGIGLVIPIQESMKHPQKFPRVLFYVMIIITVVFITMGAISYAAYGSKTETVVLLNLPQDNKLVNGVQLLYSVAILLSTPLQIFPAVRIVETELFTRSGKYNPYIKWQKNIFRFFVVMLCAAISWGGADHLDKFVALVGNFACIPLVYIYPPLLHYRAVARNRAWKIADVVLCIFGFFAMGYATSLTIMSWANAGAKPPGYCERRNLWFATKFTTVPKCPEAPCWCEDETPMPSKLDIDRESSLVGTVAPYAEQILVCTGRSDWPSKIEVDRGGNNLVAELRMITRRAGQSHGPLPPVSIVYSSFPSSLGKRRNMAFVSAYMFPSFKYAPWLLRVSGDIRYDRNAMILSQLSTQNLAASFVLPAAHASLACPSVAPEAREASYREFKDNLQDVRDVMVLICGHGNRDKRCGVMGPLLQKDFNTKLVKAGLDVRDDRVDVVQSGSEEAHKVLPRGVAPQAVRVGLISHIGGHKFAGNVIFYLPPGMLLRNGGPHPLAGHGIWYGRVEPKHVDGLIKETILGGNIVADLFRGGIDPQREMLSI